eukprot:TRINITY_DN27784_c0_g1_i1.p1 TRINITY_DN27784_c0_g1~~TRINITY_DN27784_c0_g1_i1.p1  ORF type:complete len:308 (+),score=101.79 TRINITY_DN27784_c0_g1_i1:155-1078(+)
MAASIEYTDDMLTKANEAFAKLHDKAAESLTVAELAPVVMSLLGELKLSQEGASVAFERMQKVVPTESTPWSTGKDRGAFIVFEGLDRAGKSTQSKELLAYMTKASEAAVGKDGEPVAKRRQTGMAPKWMCFPARHTPMGSLIDQYLRKKLEMCDRAVHLLFSANRWEMATDIIKELDAGKTIICDRYAFSGVVYSAAKGMDAAWCRSTDIGLPQPDLVFFLHLDPEVGAKRAAFGDERYENTQMQIAVREQFAAADFGSGEKRVAWNPVDGGQEKAVISEQIRKIVDDFFCGHAENPMPAMKPLWV